VLAPDRAGCTAKAPVRAESAADRACHPPQSLTLAQDQLIHHERRCGGDGGHPRGARGETPPRRHLVAYHHCGPLPTDLQLRTGEDPVHTEARLAELPPAGTADPLRATLVFSELPVLDRARVGDALIRGTHPHRAPGEGPAAGDAPEARAA